MQQCNGDLKVDIEGEEEEEINIIVSRETSNTTSWISGSVPCLFFIRAARLNDMRSSLSVRVKRAYIGLLSNRGTVCYLHMNHVAKELNMTVNDIDSSLSY